MKILTVAEAQRRLLDTGLLYVINRLVLHPFGLALAFATDQAEEHAALEDYRMELLSTHDGENIIFTAEVHIEAFKKLQSFVSAWKAGNKSVPKIIEKLLSSDETQSTLGAIEAAVAMEIRDTVDQEFVANLNKSAKDAD